MCHLVLMSFWMVGSKLQRGQCIFFTQTLLSFWLAWFKKAQCYPVSSVSSIKSYKHLSNVSNGLSPSLWQAFMLNDVCEKLASTIFLYCFYFRMWWLPQPCSLYSAIRTWWGWWGGWGVGWGVLIKWIPVLLFDQGWWRIISRRLACKEDPETKPCYSNEMLTGRGDKNKKKDRDELWCCVCVIAGMAIR